MELAAVAFVLGQAILGIDLIQLLHQPVTGYFRHYGSGRNGRAQGIAVYNRNRFNSLRMRMHGVHQRHLGTYPDLSQDLFHAFLGCMVNILFINIGNAHHIDQNGDGLF